MALPGTTNRQVRARPWLLERRLFQALRIVALEPLEWLRLGKLEVAEGHEVDRSVDSLSGRRTPARNVRPPCRPDPPRNLLRERPQVGLCLEISVSSTPRIRIRIQQS